MYINRDKFNYFSPASMDEGYWEDLLSLGKTSAFAAGSVIFEQHTRIAELNCITAGSVKIVHCFDNGNEKLFEQLQAPSLVGAEALWNAGTAAFYPTVLAMTDVTLCSIPLSKAEAYISRRPEVVISLYQCIRNLLCISRIRSVCSMPMSLLQKTAFAIVFMHRAERDGEGYASVTHEELAQLIGISRANVTTALAELAERGIIRKKRGRIKIVDDEALWKLLDLSI